MKPLQWGEKNTLIWELTVAQTHAKRAEPVKIMMEHSLAFVQRNDPGGFAKLQCTARSFIFHHFQVVVMLLSNGINITINSHY